MKLIMFNRKQFSNDIFMFRTTQGLSRAAAAKEIGVHPSTMQTLEGDIHEPRISVYCMVCKWMGIPMDYYFLNN